MEHLCACALSSDRPVILSKHMGRAVGACLSKFRALQTMRQSASDKCWHCARRKKGRHSTCCRTHFDVSFVIVQPKSVKREKPVPSFVAFSASVDDRDLAGV